MSKIETTMNTLHDLIENAQKAAEESKGVRYLHNLAEGFVKSTEALFASEGFDKVQVMSVGQALEVALSNAQKVADGLKVASGMDRTEGDKCARALTMAVDANWLEGDEADKATGLVNAWNATAPKGGGRTKGTGTGSSTAPSLPFPVRIKCEHDGWTATQNTSLNSVRWAAILHHADKHGSKPSKGSPIHQGLTEALQAVIEGKTVNAQGGGYLVDKA